MQILQAAYIAVYKEYDRLRAENEALKSKLEAVTTGEANSVKLREVYFDESGEPLTHREPTLVGVFEVYMFNGEKYHTTSVYTHRININRCIYRFKFRQI